MSKVKRKKMDGSLERKIATGAIVSDHFIRELRTIYKPDFMQVPFAKRIIAWALEYDEQYQAAPRAHIQDIFNSHARKDLDDDLVDLISAFLTEISSEYERADKFNADYLLDETTKYFKIKSMSNLSEDIKAELSQGNVLEAEQLLTGFKRTERVGSSGVNPFTDEEAIYDAFEVEQEPLIILPGAVGELLNDQLVREGFISFQGPEKRGKTWWLQELGIWAGRCRSNVAFFAIGDMSQRQMIRRKHVRIAGRSNLKKYCGDLLVPVLDCKRNQNDKCTHKHRESDVGLEGATKLSETPRNYSPCTHCVKNHPFQFRGTAWYRLRKAVEPLSWRDGVKKAKKFANRMRGRDYRLITFPSDSINVDGIRAQLDIWEHFEGFIPDVIIIDYADNLAAPKGVQEFRHQQSKTWKQLRAVSQERRCLVITATQTDAQSYEAEIIRSKHFTEDKRKYGEVTGMVGLNQTEEEKRAGLMRLNWVMLREGDFSVSRTVTVLQSLQMGRPLLASYWTED